MSTGWIKIHRKLQTWEWKTSPKHIAVFLDLLLEVNHKDVKYRGTLIKAGQLTTSYNAISNRTGVSIRSIRTILKDLISTSEVTHENARHYSIITILKWCDYQLTDKEADKLTTSKRQANDKLTTTNKNEKNEKNEKNTVEIVVNYLNSKMNTKYRTTSKNTISKINARLNENYFIEDFKKVIDIKYQEWINTDMAKYLTPETLFGTKFEKYINQKIPTSFEDARTNDLESMFKGINNDN